MCERKKKMNLQGLHIPTRTGKATHTITDLAGSLSQAGLKYECTRSFYVDVRTQVLSLSSSNVNTVMSTWAVHHFYFFN